MHLLNLKNKKNYMKRGVQKIFLPVGLLVLLFGCSSPKQSRNILTFFFDGVPAADTNRPGEYSQAVNSPSGGDSIAVISPSRSVYVLHEPYREKMCTACHKENALGQFNDRQPELCYLCHEDFSEKYKFIHGPVAAGYCTQCHHPHLSENKNLLIRTGQDLCLYCHDAGRILTEETHEGIDDMDCTECHNPHGGSEKYLFN